MFTKQSKNKDVDSKKDIKYVVSGLLILLILLFLLGIYGYNSLFKVGVQGKLSLSLADSKINSDEETRLFVKIKNDGKVPLFGLIKVSSESDNVIISYPEESLLNVNLLPEESITRVLSVKATSDSIRTDYKITVDFMNLEQDSEDKKFKEIISSSDIVLTVQK